MRRLASWLRRRMHPVLHADAPPGQVASGAGVGMFIALLPTIGQLYMLPPLWAGARYLLRRAFHLPMAYAMVLLINPPVKVFTFYGYLVTGDWLLRDLGYGGMAQGFPEFKAALMGPQGHWLTHAAQAVDVALRRFGVPLIAGGVLWAVVGGAAAYAFTWAVILRCRRRAAGGAAPSPAASIPAAAKHE